jgi:hypothetical protein
MDHQSNSPIAVIAVCVGSFVIVVVAMLYETQSLRTFQEPTIPSWGVKHIS